MIHLDFIACIVLIIHRYSAAQSIESQPQCRFRCKDLLTTDIESNVCHGAMNVMPKPSVYQACMKGKLLGFEHGCLTACRNENDKDERSIETCQSLKNKPIPNHHFPWCRRGYDVTYRKAKDLGKDILLSFQEEQQKPDENIDYVKEDNTCPLVH